MTRHTLECITYIKAPVSACFASFGSCPARASASFLAIRVNAGNRDSF